MGCTSSSKIRPIAPAIKSPINQSLIEEEDSPPPKLSMSIQNSILIMAFKSKKISKSEKPKIMKYSTKGNTFNQKKVSSFLELQNKRSNSKKIERQFVLKNGDGSSGRSFLDSKKLSRRPSVRKVVDMNLIKAKTFRGHDKEKDKNRGFFKTSRKNSKGLKSQMSNSKKKNIKDIFQKNELFNKSEKKKFCDLKNEKNRRFSVFSLANNKYLDANSNKLFEENLDKNYRDKQNSKAQFLKSMQTFKNKRRVPEMFKNLKSVNNFKFSKYIKIKSRKSPSLMGEYSPMLEVMSRNSPMLEAMSRNSKINSNSRNLSSNNSLKNDFKQNNFDSKKKKENYNFKQFRKSVTTKSQFAINKANSKYVEKKFRPQDDQVIVNSGVKLFKNSKKLKKTKQITEEKKLRRTEKTDKNVQPFNKIENKPMNHTINNESSIVDNTFLKKIPNQTINDNTKFDFNTSGKSKTQDESLEATMKLLKISPIESENKRKKFVHKMDKEKNEKKKSIFSKMGKDSFSSFLKLSNSPAMNKILKKKNIMKRKESKVAEEIKLNEGVIEVLLSPINYPDEN